MELWRVAMNSTGAVSCAASVMGGASDLFDAQIEQVCQGPNRLWSSEGHRIHRSRCISLDFHQPRCIPSLARDEQDSQCVVKPSLSRLGGPL